MAGRQIDEDAAKVAIQAFLEAVGAPLDDPEVRKAPELVAEAWCHDLLDGYAMNPAEILRETTASNAPGMVVLRQLPLSTICPHHLMPSTGYADIGYLPSKRVVGFGALEKLAHCYSKRLALQEDIANNIALALVEHLGAKGAGCRIVMEPTCLSARKERAHSSARVSVCAWHGSLKSSEAQQLEFLKAE